MMTDEFKGLRINKYSETDFGSLAELFRKVYVQTYPHFDQKFHETERFFLILREHILQNSYVWTAKFDGKVVGFLALEENFIDQLYVLEEFQNKGLGSFWIAESKKIYPDFLELYTFACNEKAIRFYEKHGFTIIEKGIAPDEKIPDVKMRWET